MGLFVFQTTDEASTVHVYKHLADIWAEMWIVELIAVSRAENWDDGMPEFESRNTKTWYHAYAPNSIPNNW